MSSSKRTDALPQSKEDSDELLRVAFLGPEGTYSHQAAFNRFRDNVKYIQKSTIADTFNAIPSEAPVALIPAENSIFGPVVESLDLLRLPEVGKEKVIKGEITLHVQHCLLVVRGTKLGDIKQVLSHEQALGQCSRFLKAHLPEAVLTKTPSTAAAAEAILLGDARRNSAAICSEVCATVYPDLLLFEKGIQNEGNNFTKFWIVTDSSTLRIPDTVPEKHEALLRVSSPPTQAFDLSAVLSHLELTVQHIDRRPSTLGIPFHDIYFVNVSRRLGSTSQGVPERKTGSWVEEVSCALERVRTLGWEACILGFW